MNTKTLGIFSALIIVGIAGILMVLLNKNDDGGFDIDYGAFNGIETATYELKKGENPIFVDKNNRFSFEYPSEFSISQFGNLEEGETVLAQRSSEKAGFQIFITEFDEPAESLTVEKIRSEIPDIIIKDAQPVNWHGKYVGISFSGNNSLSESTREIWIVDRGLLYQMTTYLNEQKLLKQVLETWKFL